MRVLQPARPRRPPPPGRALPAVNLAAKLLLVGLLAFSLLASDMPQFAGKAMTARALTYPLAALVVPLAWWLRGRPRPYPHLLDALLVAPFLVDVAGNALDLYSTAWFDGAAHLLNWALLVTAFGTLVVRQPLGRAIAAALAVGFGSVTHTLWELVEYGVMALGSSGLQLTYADTIADLALSLTGSLLGAVVTVTVLWWRRPRGGVGRTARDAG